VGRNYDACRARIYQAVLRYVERCPLAADTADGILLRWLPPDGFADAPDHIYAVLQALVAQGVLEATLLPDGKTLFFVRFAYATRGR